MRALFSYWTHHHFLLGTAGSGDGWWWFSSRIPQKWFYSYSTSDQIWWRHRPCVINLWSRSTQTRLVCQILTFDWLAGHSLHNSSSYKVFLTIFFKRMKDFSHRMFESQLIIETNWANISNSSACSTPCGCPVTAKERRRNTDLKSNLFIQPGLTKWPSHHVALFCVFTGLNYWVHLFWTGRVLCG